MPEGGRHANLWSWFENLQPDVPLPPEAIFWPRGGAKSSTAELGTVFVGTRMIEHKGEVRPARRFVLYVSGTQEQANNHVDAIREKLEELGVEREVTKHNAPRGWTLKKLRAANGFNVLALGLNAAARGVKLGDYRPDLIILDDVDDREDSTDTVKKKIRTITQGILPAGSSDCAILFVQNIIHSGSIAAMLENGTADFLLGRKMNKAEPAIIGLKYKSVETEDGGKKWKITDGTPTWEGQSLAICERQMNQWGEGAFIREAQHDVEYGDGYFFNVHALNYCTLSDVPRDLSLCRAWDLAGTEGGGDKTAGPLVGIAPNQRVYVVDAKIGQWGSEKVRKTIKSTAEDDKVKWGRIKLRLPQDPGQAGKDQAHQLREALSEYSPIIKPVTGSKGTRARGFAEEVNKGNVWFVIGDWNVDAKREMRDFDEDETDQEDDFIDGVSDAYNELKKPTKTEVSESAWSALND